MQYEMQRSGGCTGAQTGQQYSFTEGDQIAAPEGEFEHLPNAAVRTTGYEDRQMKASGEKRYEVREGDGGWYKVYDTVDEEYVDGESSRDPEEAQKSATRLNDLHG